MKWILYPKNDKNPIPENDKDPIPENKIDSFVGKKDLLSLK